MIFEVIFASHYHRLDVVCSSGHKILYNNYNISPAVRPTSVNVVGLQVFTNKCNVFNIQILNFFQRTFKTLILEGLFINKFR